ncbi:MAG TPA: hypothetical protein PLE81_04385 [Brevundimonas sp.]|jgi:hypothetical protein|uniref:hypothetical protein n=1 Tax=Brevundimonas sp. TaxID=1871086 RepID=UPI002CA54D13|nr:hypothetical protein [Brevundimonas sp.]HRH19859.1 hypothetical protein [Brevundimonas sp.]
MSDPDDDVFLIDEDDPVEIVHWQRPEVRLSPGEATGATLAAFGLGVLTAVGLLALLGRIRH